MNKFLLIGVVLVLAVMAFLGYKVMTKPAAAPVAVTTSSSDAAALEMELEKTVDDGGQADFDALTQEAAGL